PGPRRRSAPRACRTRSPSGSRTVSSLLGFMRFAVKVVPLGLLGFAVALLVACGNSNGLLSGSDAQSLQAALSAAQSACANGDAAGAASAAQSFSQRVDALGTAVDRRLSANLQQGASTLQSLVPRTCTGTTATTTAPTVTTTTTTTPTTTAPTTTTVPTTPTTTTT